MNFIRKIRVVGRGRISTYIRVADNRVPHHAERSGFWNRDLTGIAAAVAAGLRYGELLAIRLVNNRCDIAGLRGADGRRRTLDRELQYHTPHKDEFEVESIGVPGAFYRTGWRNPWAAIARKD